jgi:hypothetical protein
MADGLPKQGPGSPELGSLPALPLPRQQLASVIGGSGIMFAGERFLTNEPSAQTPTRNFVVSSWLRSRDLGIRPTAWITPILRDTGVPEELRRRHRELISAAHVAPNRRSKL